MKFRPTLSLIALCFCVQVTLLPAQDASYVPRDEQLQAAFLQFPLLTQAANKKGQPEFQKLDAMEPVVINGVNYCGFRFKVPQRENAEDFVWAMIQPVNLTGWYILPETGAMTGFENYRYMPKTNYPATSRLLPLNGKTLIIQSLSGDSLKDEETYLIWWSLRGKPRPMSISFTFARLGKNGLNKLPPMEKALALVHAPKPQSDPDELTP